MNDTPSPGLNHHAGFLALLEPRKSPADEFADEVLAEHGDAVPPDRTDEVRAMLRRHAIAGAGSISRASLLWWLDHATLFTDYCCNDECAEHDARAMAENSERQRHIRNCQLQLASPSLDPYDAPGIQARLDALLRADRPPADEGNGWDDDADKKGTKHDTLDAGGTHVAKRGAVHVIHGKRSNGKTWVCAAWAAQEVLAGRRVVWVDFERQRALLAEKFAAFGVTPDMRRKLVTYVPADAFNVDELLDVACGASLVVIDAGRGLTRAVAPDVHNNGGDDVQTAYDELLGPLADDGAAVVVIHHEGKSAGATDAYGADRWETLPHFVYRAVAVRPFTRTVNGHVSVTCTKDHYGVHEGSEVARFTMTDGVPELGGIDEVMPATARDNACADCGASIGARAERCKSCTAKQRASGQRRTGGKF